MLTFVPPTPQIEDHTEEAPLLTYASVFCPETQDPFDMVEWKTVDAVLKSADGLSIFEQLGVEAPVGWSDRAILIVAQKYFRGALGTPARETSVRQIVTRVVGAIFDWVKEQEYFATPGDAKRLCNDLIYLLLTQRGAFNSPVWFNLGVQGEAQQCSACFIQSVSDDLESIAQLQKDESRIFKLGSGSGSNLSTLRSSKEQLRGGGTASGPVSFMRPLDSWAGVIKSGGKCLAPEQRVYTVERGPVPVRDLAGTTFHVLSYDPPAGRFKVKRATAWKEEIQKRLVTVRTDKREFRLSVDHPAKLATGDFVCAADLSPGMLLFAGTMYADKPGDQVQLHGEDGGREYTYPAVTCDTACVTENVIDGISDVYDVEVECPTLDDKTARSGHNFLIWSGDDHFGSGIVVSNTRRAAKMVILNADHPDILEYVDSKVVEERRAHALIAAGFSADFNDPNGAYAAVAFQNANHSVRVTDDFMEQVEYALDNPDEEVLWNLNSVTTGEVLSRTPILELWNKICAATWFCGDPGIQFDTTVNDWHTCPVDGRINASNPCQPGFAPVMTPRGLRTFDDVQEGHTIWSGSAWTTITKKWRTGVKEVFRYTTRAGAFIGTESHRIVQQGSKVEVRDAETIDVCTCAGVTRGDFDSQDVLDGLMFGDGYTIYANKGANSYPVLCVGEDDQCYLKSEVALLIHAMPYDGTQHRVAFTTLAPEEMPRTYLRKVPTRFYQGNVTKVCGFLRGLYSANGSIVETRVTLKASSFDVINSVQQMLSFLGIRSYYTTNKAKDVTFANDTYTCRQSYDLNISTDRGLFRDLIGFVHPDKTARLDAACARATSPARAKTSYEVVETESLGELPVWDIEVQAEEHTYWTGGLLVSNCAEFNFLDDSACNLASLNIMKFRRDDGTFDPQSFCDAAHVFIIAQEALVSKAYYPTEKITANTDRFRPLGLGYANLGAYLMSVGLAYDSDGGRRVAAEITSMMGAQAYITSSLLAAAKGPFEAYDRNRGPMLRIIERHREAAAELGLESACLWDRAVESGEEHGFRNAQVTVLAPTGTIGFLMDCDTTGVEPDASLYKVKRLVGGGTLTMENRIVALALTALEYSVAKQAKILQWLGEHECLDDCPHLSAKHLPVFDCAIPSKGTRMLGLDAHLMMTAAVQPFLSGAISKTMNLPFDTTPAQISEAYLEAWRLNLKAVALYRDGCKLSQPLVTAQREKEEEEKKKPRASRRRLEDHQTNCHRIKFRFGDVKGYLIATPYEDTGMPGEVFVEWAKEGSTISGLVDGWAQAISYCLQYGVPLDALVSKYSHTKFEPSGFSTDPDIRFAHSIYDALMRKLAAVFLDKPVANGRPVAIEAPVTVAKPALLVKQFSSLDNPVCTTCGAITVKSGANCYKCDVCGSASGCG